MLFLKQLDFGFGFLCILTHRQGIPVGARIRVVEELVEEPEYLLIPAFDICRDLPCGVVLAQANVASRYDPAA